MESTNLYFSALVLSVCAMHLASAVSDRMSNWWQESALGKRLSLRPAVNAGDVSGKRMQRQNDWYVFFHCSDLTGKEPLPAKPASPGQERLQPHQKKTVAPKRQVGARLTLT